MSLLRRTGTGRNNIAWGGSTSTAANYLRRTGTGRNNISYINISSNGTWNILNRTSTGRNNIAWQNTTFSFKTQEEINADGFFGMLNNYHIKNPNAVAVDFYFDRHPRAGSFVKYSNYYRFVQNGSISGSTFGNNEITFFINPSNSGTVTNLLNQYVNDIIAIKIDTNIAPDYVGYNYKMTYWNWYTTNSVVSLSMQYTNPSGVLRNQSPTQNMYFK